MTAPLRRAWVIDFDMDGSRLCRNTCHDKLWGVSYFFGDRWNLKAPLYGLDR
jgi:hypothetical protein